jgi:hypothetical protein
MERVTAPPEGAIGPAVFTDGFGARFLGIDPEAGDTVEILSFDPALVAAPDFAASVGVRVARLSGARHALFARVRRIDRPSPDSLLLVSDRIAGWRLSEVLDVAARERITLDISAVLNLMRQLIPAVALFGRHQRDLAVGTIAPQRLILTPSGRLLIAEYVLGAALDKLSLTREQSWRDYRVAVAAAPGQPRDAQRSDVLGIGIVALSLLLGRSLRDDEFPDATGDLLQQVTEMHDGEARPLSPRLASWLARALQLEGHKPLASPKDAQVAFEEVLANERGYVTSPALLDDFVSRFAQRAGAPAEIPSVVEEPAVATLPAQQPPFSIAAQTPEPEAVRPAQPRWAPEPSERIWATEPVWQPVADRARPAEEQSSIASVEPPVVQAVEPPMAKAVRPPTTESDERPTVETVEAPGAEFGDLFEPRPADATSSTELPASGAVAAQGETEVAPSAEPAGDAARGWMTKALAALAVLAVVEAAAILWFWSRSSDALVRDGELTVQSRPVGARVSVEDDEVGVTPVSVRLAPGTYTLKVQVGNAEPRVIVVQIRAGVQTAQYLELQTGR